jgi:hypothetical protein
LITTQSEDSQTQSQTTGSTSSRKSSLESGKSKELNDFEELSSHEDEQQQTELEDAIKQAADNEDEEPREDDQMSLDTYFPRQEIN